VVIVLEIVLGVVVVVLEVVLGVVIVVLEVVLAVVVVLEVVLAVVVALEVVLGVVIALEVVLGVVVLSSYVRARTSVQDERTSAESMGYLGIVLLSTIVGLFVLSDCLKLISFLFNKSTH
jgi:hypothetical protein